MNKKTTKKKTVKTAADAAVSQIKRLEEGVRNHLGDVRMAKLAKQPMCIAKGGMGPLIESACKVAAGWPQPLRGSVVVTLQSCGSKAQEADLAIKE